MLARRLRLAVGVSAVLLLAAIMGGAALLADARALVSVSPQPGFLHQRSELDTLGIDEPETPCRPPS